MARRPDCCRVAVGASVLSVRTRRRWCTRGLLALAAVAAGAAVSRAAFTAPMPSPSARAAAVTARSARGAGEAAVAHERVSPTTDDELRSAISDGGLVLAKITQRRCRSCRTMADEFRKVAERVPEDVTLMSLDASRNMDFVKAQGLKTAPTTLLFMAGSQTPVEAFTGVTESDVLIAAIEERLSDLSDVLIAASELAPELPALGI